MKTIDIGTEFSRYPAARYAKSGPFSGEEFREEILVPALNEHEEVSIKLDGTAGYGSSFLEETFGGCVRNNHINAAEMHKKLTLISNDETLKNEIWEYIDQASPKT